MLKGWGTSEHVCHPFCVISEGSDHFSDMHATAQVFFDLVSVADIIMAAAFCQQECQTTGMSWIKPLHMYTVAVSAVVSSKSHLKTS